MGLLVIWTFKVYSILRIESLDTLLSLSPLLQELIESLQCLPGVGRKSAQRMALHLLERDRAGARMMANVLERSMNDIKKCQLCRVHTEQPRCNICADKTRDQALLCIVESPMDLMAIEQAGGYHGYYFVLHGRISPLDGMGPQQLGFSQLARRIGNAVKEVVVATSITVEGEATAHYLVEVLKEIKGHEIAVSRIAHGVPMGGDLDMISASTLAHALSERKPLAIMD